MPSKLVKLQVQKVQIRLLLFAGGMMLPLTQQTSARRRGSSRINDVGCRSARKVGIPWRKNPNMAAGRRRWNAIELAAPRELWLLAAGNLGRPSFSAGFSAVTMASARQKAAGQMRRKRQEEARDTANEFRFHRRAKIIRRIRAALCAGSSCRRRPQ